jgi:hypothetical protein
MPTNNTSASFWSPVIFVQQVKCGMASSGMLRHVALVRTDVSLELSDSFIRVTRIGELGTTLAVTRNRCASVASYSKNCSKYTDSCHIDEGDAKFQRNVGSYKSHAA